MTLGERAAAFESAFPKWPASWPRLVKEQGRDVLYATWLIGNDYRNATKFYGSYPPGYLARVMALFPDSTIEDSITVLHVFSGSLPAGPYLRCDCHQPAELQCSVYDLSRMDFDWLPRLVIADPPYSAADAERYGTAMIDRRRALSALAEVTEPGGHLVWLDQVWPMHRKAEWRTVGRITVVRSTNHRVRLASIFERVA